MEYQQSCGFTPVASQPQTQNAYINQPNLPSQGSSIHQNYQHPPPTPIATNRLPPASQTGNQLYELSADSTHYASLQSPGVYEQTPPIPHRHGSHRYNGQAVIDFQYQQPDYHSHNSTNPQMQPQSSHEPAPPLPLRSQYRTKSSIPSNSYQPVTPTYGPMGGFGGYQCTNSSGYMPATPPPQRFGNPFEEADDPADPVHYIRDPHKLVAYLVPFPKPQLEGIDPATIPSRFLIYTPPPPPLTAPKEGEKEGKLHKVQRKWQQEVRSAKTSTAKVASWQGVKSRATKAIAWGVNQTTTSNIEFLGRINGDNSGSDSSAPGSPSSDSSAAETTKKTVGVSEMLLVYPPSMGMSPTEMRTEFVNTMLRTKSKAQRDSIIATGLLPVGFGIDIMATLIWPFGGLGEIDSVWLYSSLRGAKTARSVTKRLSSSSESGNLNDDTLHLNFTPSARLDVLSRYLEAECHRVDGLRFPTYRSPPTESEVLEAIGWSPSQCGGEEKNWEDEQWEMTEVREDVKSNMHKGAKEWKKFCVAFAKDPEKAMKK